MRITKANRKQNAIKIYNSLKNSGCQAIVVQRSDSTTNPNVNRTQFIAASFGNPVVIAESSTLGIEGCFIEFIEFLKGGIVQTTYHECGFNEWLEKNLGIKITYNDGFVIMLNI